MSDKKGEPRRIKMKLLAEAWAREAQQELEAGLQEKDAEPMVQAVRSARDRQLGRRPAVAKA